MKATYNRAASRANQGGRVALLCLLAASGSAAMADSKSDAKAKHQPIELLPAAPIARGDAQTVLGRSERVAVMEGPKSVEITGNLDTKEAKSTLYVADMKYFSRDYEQWVRFTIDSGNVVSSHKLDIERKVLRDERVKERGGGYSHRPWVEVNLCIGKHYFTSKVALMDRSAYTAQLKLGTEDIDLIGRVDTALQFTAQPECEPPKPPAPASTAEPAPVSTVGTAPAAKP